MSPLAESISKINFAPLVNPRLPGEMDAQKSNPVIIVPIRIYITHTAEKICMTRGTVCVTVCVIGGDLSDLSLLVTDQ